MDAEVERLRKKVENFPSPSSYNRLAELLVDHGQIDDAVAMCQRSMRDFPRNALAYVILARIHRGLGKQDEAVACFRQAIQQDGRCYPAYLELAELHQAAGRIDDAAQGLRAILGFKPDDEEARRRLDALGSGAVQAMGDDGGDDDGDSVVDLTGLTTGLTSIVANRKLSATGASPRSRSPAAGKAASDILAGYCDQDQVRCALIADKRGRCAASRGLPPGLDDLVAALADEITSLASDCLTESGAGSTTNWTISAEKGQILSFNEHHDLSLIAIANPGIKVAMLELRARQAMLDIGGAI